MGGGVTFSPVDALFRRTRAVLAGLLLVMVAGVIALQEIPKEAEPDVDLPFFHVSASLSGLRPDDVDRLLVRPIERELRDLEDLVELRSTATTGQARLSLEFKPDFDRTDTEARIRERLAVVQSKLPAGASRARVRETNLGLGPLIVVTLSGPYDDSRLMTLARGPVSYTHLTLPTSG